MSELLSFVIIGAASGAVYSLAGVGLVLTFRTSGIFNFAHGAIATLAAFLFYFLWQQNHVPLGLSLFISIALLAVVLGLGFERIGRVVSRGPLAWRVVSTVGVLLVVEAVFTILYGTSTGRFPEFLPTDQIHIGSVSVGTDQIILFGVSLLASVGLSVALARTRIGKSVQGLVDNPELLSLTGTSPVTVRRAAWIIGCVFAAGAGLLLSPNLPLNANSLTLLVVQAFGAAAIGRFRSLPWTWVGGIVIGIAGSVATEYVGSNQFLPGLPASMPFIVLFLALLFSRRERTVSEEVVTKVERHMQAPVRVRVTSLLVLVVALVFVPQLVGVYLDGWTTALTYIMLFLSAGLLVRTSGQVSLCHIAFAAVGAVAFAKLVGAGVPWFPAIIIGALVAVPVGAVLAIPAIRSSALNLAIATFGFGILLENMFYNTSVMFGAHSIGLYMPEPSWGWLHIGGSESYYYVVLAFTLAAGLVVVGLTGGRLGRLLRGLSDAPVALASLGTGTVVLRVLVFCISAYIAAVSGALSGVVLTQVTGAAYDPFTSLTILVLVLISAGGPPWYAIIAGLGLGIAPVYISGNVNEYLQIIFGASAVLVSVMPSAEAPQWLRKAVGALGPRGSGARIESVAVDAGSVSVDGSGIAKQHGASSGRLELGDVTVRFGGNVAVDCVSLIAPLGQVTGLIGPNGAGKSTLLNVASGLVRPDSGSVLMGGEDLTPLTVSGRARRGLGRTFQRVQLFESLTVWDNVSLGVEAALAGNNIARQVVARPSDIRMTDRKVNEALELCGIGELASTEVTSLSTGQRRLVEVARCLAGEFKMLLFDEPSSGLDAAETARLGMVMTRVVESRGLGILLVEHDMSIVMSVCRSLYVLDFGQLIFSGTPEAARASSVVQAAYLGSGFGESVITDTAAVTSDEPVQS